MPFIQSSSKIKYVVIIGYALLFIVMILGIITVYKNLVNFSERKVKDEDLRELIIVGNTISKLYEIESAQNFFSIENAQEYFERYNATIPQINANLDTLKSFSKDSARIGKLDTINLLLIEKEKNLREITILLDSIRKVPTVVKQTINAFVPKNLNKDIADYLERQNIFVHEDTSSDTTIIKAERKRLFGRIKDAFVGKQDSTVIVENRPTVTREKFAFAIDTVVNMVRYSERLNLERQKRFQYALLDKHTQMSNTNTMLTARIDELLKEIETEELKKSIQLLKEKENTLSNSQKTVYGVSWAAFAIALIFGLMFLADINASNRYRKQLEISNKKIKDLLQLREMLMLSISHDIKAPASSIQGYIELMSDDLDTEKGKHYLRNMKNSTEHILTLANNLLDFRKLQDGLWLKKEINFNLYNLTNEIALSFKPIAEAKKLKFRIDNHLPNDLMVFSDPYMMRQIFSNIISNAIKYTPQGSVSVMYRVESTDNKQLRLQFSVKDTGCGIDKAYQEVIFQEFKQLHVESLGQKGEGNGLGLAIVKGLTEALEGHIAIQSEKGKGAEFIVSLPLKRKKPTEIEKKTAKTYHYDLQNLSALIIDDDPMQLTMLSEMLQRKAMRVTTESVPQNAIEILKEKKFDIIFIDIQMPVMNGLELVRKIASINQSTPKIALSAKSEISLQDIKNHGFNDFLNKPFTSSEIYDVVHRYIQNTAFDTVDEEQNRNEGVYKLIEFVKDDKESSLNILHSFEEETSKNLLALNDALACSDIETSSNIAHKILPLFKMINDDETAHILALVESKKPIADTDKKRLFTLIKKQMEATKKLILQIENR